MPGDLRELAEHKLKVYRQARTIRQKLHRFTPDKREAIRAELAHLVLVGFIREVLHPEWLANPVLVLKIIKLISACASTILISTSIVRRIPSGSLEYIM
jgi:fructose-specific phosphotransferase system IIC component